MSTTRLTRSFATLRVSGGPCSRSRLFTTSSQTHAPETPDKPSEDDAKIAAEAQEIAEKAKPKHKTVAEADAELMAKLAGHADEGGAAGVEYEDGKPVAQKRSVRKNMFRLI
ncbi:hypothetical protein Slin15195_G103970 [Septoria linicola]|uniref:Uncharacterized protein n=1 Tax=Septoria linicola TaxID=215465 RepID=A0A9Q9EQ14_9PEZI|nr:hypothetical protein Slin15195_G103970 [Septoria linicola]